MKKFTLNKLSNEEGEANKNENMCGLRATGGFQNLCHFFVLRTAIFTEIDGDSKWIIILIDHVIYFICSCT